jgi:hypothetical protein
LRGRSLRRVRLLLRWSEDDWHRISKFHDIIHEHLDIIGPGDFEFHLREDRYVGGVKSGILENEFDFALAQDARLVRADEADAFGELANTGGPAVKKAELKRDDRDLRDANEVDHANEKKIAGDFLANFFAEKGALQVGENSGRVHRK